MRFAAYMGVRLTLTLASVLLLFLTDVSFDMAQFILVLGLVQQFRLLVEPDALGAGGRYQYWNVSASFPFFLGFSMFGDAVSFQMYIIYFIVVIFDASALHFRSSDRMIVSAWFDPLFVVLFLFQTIESFLSLSKFYAIVDSHLVAINFVLLVVTVPIAYRLFNYSVLKRLGVVYMAWSTHTQFLAMFPLHVGLSVESYYATFRVARLADFLRLSRIAFLSRKISLGSTAVSTVFSGGFLLLASLLSLSSLLAYAYFASMLPAWSEISWVWVIVGSAPILYSFLVFVLGPFGYALLSIELNSKQVLVLISLVTITTCNLFALRFYEGSSDIPIIILAIFTVFLGGFSKVIWSAGVANREIR
jgi:hypothetical protein